MSSLVPDRLHQGQVTRAQEAEENYLVKRELATVKQQSEEVSAQLKQAQSTIRQLQQQQHPVVRTVHRQRRLLDGRTSSESAAQRKRGCLMRKTLKTCIIWNMLWHDTQDVHEECYLAAQSGTARCSD